MKTIQKLVFFISVVSLCGCNNQPEVSKKNEPFRGFMIDAPRTVESIDYYFRLIDFCHDEGLNSIIFRLTDDEGSAYRFKSHPELKTCEGAFSAQELTDLVAYAQQKGIEIIPEVESFGHARYIIETERYKSLNDGAEGESFNAVCPVSDTTLQLMNDLYTEISAIFTSDYFHIGCDEVNWGSGELSKEALKTKSRHQIWADYINSLNGYVKALGKKTIIWGDVPIYHEKKVLDLINRDVVIMDWNYWEANKDTVQAIADTLLSKGFQVIGCPAASWCRWGPRVGSSQFDNVNAYAAVYGHLDNPDNLGIICSNWVPQKYLQGGQWDTYKIVAEIIKNKGNYKYMDALPVFVKNHFDADWDTTWEKIYRVAYEKAPQSFCGESASAKFLLWASEQDIQDILKKNSPVENPFTEIKEQLGALKDRVKKNQKDYNDLLMTIEFLDYVINRQNSLLQVASSGQADLKSVNAYTQKIAAEDSVILAKIDTAWEQGRRSTANKMHMETSYMMSFYKASNFSKKLSGNSAALVSMLRQYK